MGWVGGWIYKFGILWEVRIEDRDLVVVRIWKTFNFIGLDKIK